MKILICEDDRISNVLFNTHLQKLGFKVTSVINGKTAYETYLNDKEINFLIINWVMPEMNGLELCFNIRSLKKDVIKDRIRPYIIMLTSNSSKLDVVQGLKSGADDFISKPFDKEILLLKVNVGKRILQAEQKNLLYNSIIKKELEKQRKYLKHAQVLQKNLNTAILPSSRFFNIKGFFMPCDALGGDFFDIHRYQHYLIIFIADYSGHGIKVAINAALCKSIADRHIHLLHKLKISKFFFLLNNDLLKYISGGDFCTAFACVIDEKNNIMYYCNANHPLPYIVRRKNNKPSFLDYENTKNFFLGILPNSNYQQNSVILEPNDRLYFYSDAIYEILKKDKLIFGIRELRKLLLTLPTHSLNKTLDKFISVFKKQNGQLPLRDDCTLIMLQQEQYYRKKKIFKNIDTLNKEMENIKKKLKRMEYDEDQCEEVLLVFQELFTNAFKHGNQHDISKKIDTEFYIDCQEVFFTIRDDGEGFDPMRINMPTEGKYFNQLLQEFDSGKSDKLFHGRGIWMAKKYTSRLSYNVKGNEVKAFFSKKEQKTKFYFH